MPRCHAGIGGAYTETATWAMAFERSKPQLPPLEAELAYLPDIRALALLCSLPLSSAAW
jgi:hypothetical protein